MEVTAGLLTRLAHPPTPPKDFDMEVISETTGTNFDPAQFPRRLLDTPDESPSSSTGYFSKPSERPLKRVDFLDDTSKDLTTASRKLIASRNGSPAWPSSRSCKPMKSILKPYKDSILSDPVTESADHKSQSFPRMMDEVIRELACSARSSRLDAYQTLIGCLKTYDEMPDPQAMVEKLPLLVDFIRRDMVAEKSDGGISDTQLILQALALLSILLSTPRLEELLPDEFRSFILDRATTFIGDPRSSKTLVIQHMSLLSMQRFRSKIMTQDRAIRLLDTLSNITMIVKGNRIVGLRLTIYHALLHQANKLMASRPEDWVDHLFSAMVSNIKDIRIRALVFGTDASFSLGTISQVSQSVLDIFNRQSPDGKKFAGILMHRLKSMIGSKEEGAHVPQIWSVVILFIRNRRSQFSHWEYMIEWLEIIQQCLNSNEDIVKSQAHLAWNRLIFAVGPSTSTQLPMVKMLRQPILSQLDRKASEKGLKPPKHIAHTSCCTLLYYALRPGSSYESLDRFWDEYVAQLLVKIDPKHACQVLTALLGDSHRRLWNENRVKEHMPIKPDELPRLDPTWTRLRAGKVLLIIDLLLQSSDWQPLGNGAPPWIVHSWQAFTKALADAGSKEIKVSTECLSAMAHLMSSMKRYLVHIEKDNGIDSLEESVRLKRISTLVEVAVTNLGPIPFAEKRILKKPGQSFEAAETLPGWYGKERGYLASPFMHIIGIVSASGTDAVASRSYEDTIRGFIQLALRSTTSRSSKIEVLRDIVALTSSEIVVIPRARIMLWQLTCELLVTLTSFSKEESTPDNQDQAGKDHWNMVQILQGEVEHSQQMSKTWVAAFKYVNPLIQREYGIDATISSIFERFADFLQKQLGGGLSPELIERVTFLIENAPWPQSQKDMKEAHRSLLGSSSMPARIVTLVPSYGLCRLISETLLMAYTNFETIHMRRLKDLLQSLCIHIQSCPLHLYASLLKDLQNGLAVWIKDERECLRPLAADGRFIYPVVLQLWKIASQRFLGLHSFDSSLLYKLQPLLCACYSSKHKAILDLSIGLWSSTFGSELPLQYPKRLLKVLQRVRMVAELQLPGIDFQDDAQEGDSSPFCSIEDSEELEQSPNGSSGSSVVLSHVQSVSDLVLYEHDDHCYGLPRICLAPETLESSQWPQQAKTTPEARLPHEDSPIHFVAIDSPPAPPDLELQCLNTGQDEVEGRQNPEVSATFPNSRSSPIIISGCTFGSLPKLNMVSTDAVAHHDYMVEEDASPTLLPSSGLNTTFLGLSPTPRSSGSQRNIPEHEYRPPSSPTQLKSQPVDLDNKQTSPLTGYDPLDRAGELLAASEASHEPQESQNRAVLDAVQTSIHVVGPEKLKMTMVSPEEQLQSREVSGSITHTTNPDMDGSVPTPTAPEDDSVPYRACYDIKAASVVEKASDMPEALSGYMAEDLEIGLCSEVSDREDEVSAQIANDMERAITMSQAEDPSEAAPLSRILEDNSNRKRKTMSLFPETSNKKRRQEALFNPAQIVIDEKDQVFEDEEMLDVIVVTPLAIVDTPPTNYARLNGVLKDGHGATRVAEIRRRNRPRRLTAEIVENDVPKAQAMSSDTRLQRLSQSRPMLVENGEIGHVEDPVCGLASSVLIPVSTTTSVFVPATVTFGTDKGLDSGRTSPALELGRQVASTISPALSSIPREEVVPEARNGPEVDEARLQRAGNNGFENEQNGQVTGAIVLQRLRSMLAEVEELVLNSGEGREIISAWMDVGRAFQNAEQRGRP